MTTSKSAEEAVSMSASEDPCYDHDELSPLWVYDPARRAERTSWRRTTATVDLLRPTVATLGLGASVVALISSFGPVMNTLNGLLGPPSTAADAARPSVWDTLSPAVPMVAIFGVVVVVGIVGSVVEAHLGSVPPGSVRLVGDGPAALAVAEARACRPRRPGRTRRPAERGASGTPGAPR